MIQTQRWVYTACCVLTFLILVSSEALGQDFSNRHTIEERLQTLFAASDSKLSLDETLLLVSKHWKPALDPAPLKQSLDALTQSVKNRLKPSMPPEQKVEILRQAIHHEAGYRYTDNVDAQGIPVNPEELFLHGLLTTRRGYCMTLSLLYLIIGEHLGLPLYGVPLPNHFFVRYDDGNTRINIEATEMGVTWPDQFYLQRFGLKEGTATRFFMRNLGKRQTLGAYFSNVGMVYYRNGNPDKAVFYLKPATEINPGSIEAQNNLANIYTEMKRYDDAIRHYRLALKSDPNNLATLFNLGLTLEESRHPAEAIEAFLQVVQIDPGFSPAHQALSRLYLRENKPFGALLHLNKLALQDPQNLEVVFQIGAIYQRIGHPEAALNLFKQAALRFPRNMQVRHKLAEMYYRAKHYDDAIQEYRYLIEQHPENLLIYVQLGWTYYRKGETRLAVAWTKRGLNKAGETGKFATLAQMNLGLYSIIENNHAEARDWYNLALNSEDPAMVQAMIDDLSEATNLFPKRNDLHFFSGWVYLQSGQQVQARDMFRRYLKSTSQGTLAEEARAYLKSMGEEPSQDPSISEEKQASAAADPEGMVKIPAGFFIMGSNDHGEDEAPEHRVYLDAYLIDKFEVSTKDFAEFLNDVNNTRGHYLDNKFGTLYYDGRFKPRPGLEMLPINNVKWHGAKAYCEWKKKRLPTEAEWEKAARGTDRRIYPWGNSPPTPQKARYLQFWTEEIKHGVLVPVNSMPEGASPYGIHHMAGNVKEWVDDWYDREYYKDQSEYINPQGQIGGEFKVLKGGSWRDLAGFLYASFRNNAYPDARLDDYGFRCAKSISPDEAPKKLTQGTPAFRETFVSLN